MKKITAFWVVTGCLLSLTACADREAGMAAELAPPENRTEEAYLRIIGMESGIWDGSPAESGETPGSNGEQAHNGGGAEERLVAYEAEDIYMSVSLPDTWACRIKTVEDMEKEGGDEVCAIEFWPEAFPEAVFEFGYHQWFGICGTGVTSERMELTSGLTGYRHYEAYEKDDSFWTAIVFDRVADKDSEGTYVIRASPGLSVWEQIRPEFEKILDSVRVGKTVQS